MKLCTDCKHYKDIGGSFTVVHGCANEKCGAQIDPVDGLRIYKKCSAARRFGEPCGPDGKLWKLRK